MTRRPVAALLGLLALTGHSQAAAQERPPDFRVYVWGEASADFRERLDAYAKLRTELERGLPPLQITGDARELVQRVKTLRERLRAARRHAKVGDIFTPAVGTAFRQMFQAQTNTLTCAALADENPGALGLHINGTYPTHQPFSTMPANVLAALPRLPDDIEYRLEGRHLMLLDMRARMLVDVLPSAVLCGGQLPEWLPPSGGRSTADQNRVNGM